MYRKVVFVSRWENTDFSPAETYSVIGSHTNQTIGFVSMPSKTVLREDPMVDQWNWFSNKGHAALYSSQFSLTSIHYNCWDKREISDWLEEHVEELVFIQPNRGAYDSYVFTFLDDGDRFKFQEWWSKKKKEHSFYLEFDSERAVKRELDVWCQQNLKGRYDVSCLHESGGRVFIKEFEEAALFKLFFSDLTSEYRR